MDLSFCSERLTPEMVTDKNGKREPKPPHANSYVNIAEAFEMEDGNWEKQNIDGAYDKIRMQLLASEYFKKAVMISTATSLTYNRTAGKASFTPNVINTFFDETDIAKQTSTGLTYTPVLAGISKEDCVGESMTDSGETVTLVFNLKSVTVPASSSPAQTVIFSLWIPTWFWTRFT